MTAIVEFYRGTGTDHRGRTIGDIWAFDAERLEAVHDFIQWLFPTKRPSGFNPWAPVLDAGSIAELQAIPDLRERVRRSLDLMLAVYGLERVGDGVDAVIREAATIEERGPRWWGAGNHNHLRLTRIIDSLGLLGLADEARGLEHALRDVRAGHPTGISDETARYWAAAAPPPDPIPDRRRGPMASTPTRPPGTTVDAGLLQRTAELATGFLASLPDRPVSPRVTRDALLATLGGPLPDEPADPLEVVEALAAAADPGLVAMAGPRYFGFVIGGSLPAALAADWLTSTWDQNAGLYAAGPSASVVEEVVGDWLVDLLGLPAGTSIGLTTGCQMAHVTCLAAARHAVLARVGWEVEDDGLFGAPEIAVVVGSEAHATIGTALQYLGLGRTRTIVADSDEQGRLRLDALAAALPDGDAPLIVNLQAGNVNTGAFDPLGPAIDLIRARRPDAWVHVDGAFGLWAAAAPAYRHLLAGHDGADSWATDGHKWLNVPYDSGFAFVRDPDQHRAAMAPLNAAYIVYGAGERDEFQWVPEYSRRARGFATYAALRSLGRRGVADQIETSCRQATRLAAALRSAGRRVEILNDVVLDQVLVRFLPPASGDDAPEPAAIDAYTRDVVRRVQDDGTCWLGGSTWHGMAAMRVSIVNWSTTDADIDRSAEAILRAAELA